MEQQTKKKNKNKGVVINGVKWAACNVDKPGTFTARPEDAGMSYQWNRMTGWSITDPLTGRGEDTEWDGCDYHAAAWEKANDPSPGGWRLPSREEFEKLLDREKVTSQWTTQNGINGRKFTDRATGNSIFLPAEGCRDCNGMLRSAGKYGLYWSSTVLDANCAYYMVFSGDSIEMNYASLGNGLRLRLVAEPENNPTDPVVFRSYEDYVLKRFKEDLEMGLEMIVDEIEEYKSTNDLTFVLLNLSRLVKVYGYHEFEKAGLDRLDIDDVLQGELPPDKVLINQMLDVLCIKERI